MSAALREKPLRTVRSYVLRGGRLTAAQQRALDEIYPRLGVPDGQEMLDFPTLFGRECEVVLEIGFGNGEATWHMAGAEPHRGFVGVEVHAPGIGRLLQALDSKGISNVRVVMADVVEFLDRRVPEASLHEVRIYFPDPWPKKRHHKRRLIQPGFVDLLAAKMRTGALLHLATDWAPYAEHMLTVLSTSGAFDNLSASGDFCDQPTWRPDTKYERRGNRLGHDTRDLLFQKKA